MAYRKAVHEKKRPAGFPSPKNYSRGATHLLSWRDSYRYGFRLELWETANRDSRLNGRFYLAYQFYHREQLIFQGESFGSSPCHSIDGGNTIGALLTFLSLRPGDTDSEYFDRYTSDQLAWAEEYGETVSWIAAEIEEKCAARRDRQD